MNRGAKDAADNAVFPSLNWARFELRHRVDTVSRKIPRRASALVIDSPGDARLAASEQFIRRARTKFYFPIAARRARTRKPGLLPWVPTSTVSMEDDVPPLIIAELFPREVARSSAPVSPATVGARSLRQFRERSESDSMRGDYEKYSNGWIMEGR